MSKIYSEINFSKKKQKENLIYYSLDLRSASSQIIKGDLPPSSSDTRLRFDLAAAS